MKYPSSTHRTFKTHFTFIALLFIEHYFCVVCYFKIALPWMKCLYNAWMKKEKTGFFSKFWQNIIHSISGCQKYSELKQSEGNFESGIQTSFDFSVASTLIHYIEVLNSSQKHDQSYKKVKPLSIMKVTNVYTLFNKNSNPM